MDEVLEMSGSGAAEFYLATVVSIDSNGAVIQIDGQSSAMSKSYKTMGNVTVGTRAVVMKHSGTFVVLGSLGGGSSGSGGISIIGMEYVTITSTANVAAHGNKTLSTEITEVSGASGYIVVPQFTADCVIREQPEINGTTLELYCTNVMDSAKYIAVGCLILAYKE